HYSHDVRIDPIFVRVPRHTLLQHTCLQFMTLNTLYQLYALQQSRSPALDCADTLLFMPDLFNYLFTGRRQSEFSIATTSQMYDPRKNNWSDDLLNALGLPRRIMPNVVLSGTLVGPVQNSVAVEFGLPSPIPVIGPAAHDT